MTDAADPQARLIEQLLREEIRPTDVTPYEKAEADNWLGDLISKKAAVDKELQDTETARFGAEENLAALQQRYDLLAEWSSGQPTWDHVNALKEIIARAGDLLASTELAIHTFLKENPGGG